MSQRIDPKLSCLKTGELLVKEGFISQEEIKIALKIQQQEKALKPRPLGMILVQKGLISKEHLNRLLAHPELRKNIGTMAIEKGLIDADHLAACLREKGSDEHIGKMLVRKGYISPDDLEAFLRKQLAGIKLGQLALRENLISRNDLEKALNMNKFQRLIGEILCDMDLIKPLELNYVLRKYNKHLKLGKILLKQGSIDMEQLDAALEIQGRENNFLGRILLEKGFITADQLYSALAEQYNIPFKKLEGYFLNESQKKSLLSLVSRAYAAKNQIIPISLEGKILTLAVAVPRCSLCLKELRSLYTHLQMRCILITEEKFNHLFRMFCGENPPLLRLVEDKLDQHTISDIQKMNSEAAGIKKGVTH